MWDTLWQSTVLVAASEIGDKTQLLAFALAARFRRPMMVLLGILIATLFNHALAALLGSWSASFLEARTLAAITALLFFAFGFWSLRPDTLDNNDTVNSFQDRDRDAFVFTAVAFFFAEMGDKTQFATLTLGARYQDAATVTAGTTLGMLIADGLAVALGQRFAPWASSRYFRWVASGLFFIFGIRALITLL